MSTNLGDKRVAITMYQITNHPLSKKGDFRNCSKYRTISLISHASKIMLKILLERLNPQAEYIISEEQAGFRKGRNAVEQNVNCQIIIDKYLGVQKNLFITSLIFKMYSIVYGTKDFGP